MKIKSIMRKNVKYMLSLLMCMCLVGTSLTSVFAKNNNTSLSLIIEQNFDIKGEETSEVDDLFHYRLTALSDEAPMPQGSSNNQYFFSIKGNDCFEVGPMTYLHEGVYRYQLSHISLASNNYTYDNSTFNIIVYVTKENGIHSVVENTNTGEKVSKIEYTHSYNSQTGGNEGGGNEGNGSNEDDGGDVLGENTNVSSNNQVTTDDQSPVNLYLGLTVVSFISLLILCVIYIRKERSCSE